MPAVRCKSAWNRASGGPTAAPAYASPSPTTAPAFPPPVSAASSSPSTPLRKTPEPASDCGFPTASSRNTGDRFGFAAAWLDSATGRVEPFSPFFSPTPAKPARSPEQGATAPAGERYYDFRTLESPRQPGI